MSFKLPDLPFGKQDFGKDISAETFDYHHGKHHKKYVDDLNSLIKGSNLEGGSLEQIILNSQGKIFNNAAQHWNHTFYWHCITPEKGTKPTGALNDLIVKKWGSLDKFVKQFNTNAKDNFGSGWTWLARKGDEISIQNTSNAGNPMTKGLQPLLTVDIWEHAYYIDYRNARQKYLETIGEHINWKFVERNFSTGKVDLEIQY